MCLHFPTTRGSVPKTTPMVLKHVLRVRFALHLCDFICASPPGVACHRTPVHFSLKRTESGPLDQHSNHRHAIIGYPRSACRYICVRNVVLSHPRHIARHWWIRCVRSLVDGWWMIGGGLACSLAGGDWLACSLAGRLGGGLVDGCQRAPRSQSSENMVRKRPHDVMARTWSPSTFQAKQLVTSSTRQIEVLADAKDHTLE